ALFEPDVARHREQRRRPERAADAAGRVECAVGLHREDREVGVAHRLVVRRARRAAEFGGRLLRTLRLARADHHLVAAEGDEPRRERPPEAARAAEDRYLHTRSGACTTAAASRRAAPTSVISVCVASVRTPGTAPPAASASSITSTSRSPS